MIVGNEKDGKRGVIEGLKLKNVETDNDVEDSNKESNICKPIIIIYGYYEYGQAYLVVIIIVR